MVRLRIIPFLILLCLAPSIMGQAHIDSLYPPLFEVSKKAPEKLSKVSEGEWFADFGRAAFGKLAFYINCTTEGTATVRLGEKITASGRIDSKPGGSVRYAEKMIDLLPGQNYCEIELTPDKRNTNPPAVQLPDSFGVIIPFRYCSFSVSCKTVGEPVLMQKTYSWIFDEKAASFSSSDTILNKVWELCKYSIKATSFAGYYVDGDRERIPYEADALINQLSHYATDSEYTLARRTNEYFMTNPTWPTEWILHTVLLFYYDYLYTGDISALRRNYEKLRIKTLLALSREDGLISTSSESLDAELMKSLGFSDPKVRLRDIVDWPPAQKDTGWKLATPEGERDGYEMVPVNTVVNAFHYRNLVLMSQIAGRLGLANDSIHFSERAAHVKESVNRKLFNREKGVYRDGEGSDHSSLHANMFPLAFGMVEEEYKGTVVSFIKSRGMACSVYGSQFLLDALYEAGEEDYALSLLTSVSDRSWYNMIRKGSTITLEAWDEKYKPNLDWNHAWGAAPANIIVRRLWGIRPAVPGFEEAIIEPRLSGLDWSEITAPTIKGQVKCSYKLDPGGKKEYYKIVLPEGMTADFVIPNREVKIVNINGRKAGPFIPAKIKGGENKITVLRRRY